MDSHYEHLSIRGFPEARIRKSTLKPFVEGWETPTPEEVRNVMKMAGLTGKTASELVGLSNTRTVRRWIGGGSRDSLCLMGIALRQSWIGRHLEMRGVMYDLARKTGHLDQIVPPLCCWGMGSPIPC